MKTLRFVVGQLLPEALLLCVILALANLLHGQAHTTIGGGTGRTTWGAGQAAVLSLPQTVNFPTTQQGLTSAAQTVTLNNLGTIPATVSAFNIANGPNPGDFHVTGTTCGALPFLIGSGTSCDLSLTFTPSGLGTRSATLTITSDALINPSANLIGTGVSAAGQSDSTLTPNTLTFPDTLVSATSASQDITLNSTGNATLNVSSVVVSGVGATDFSADFTLTNGTCGAAPFSVPQATSCVFHLTFTPSGSGIESANVTVASNGLSSPNVTLISGKGIAPASSLTSSLNFGTLDVGTTSAPPLTSTFTNTGGTNLSITNIALGGTNPGDFAIASQDCGTLPATLLPGNACHVNLTCTPTVAGVRSATLSVTDADTGTHSTTLSCTGQTPAPSLAINTASCPNATVGQAYSCTLQVSGGTPPYSFTTPSSAVPPGAIDLFDYLCPPASFRAGFHMEGATKKYCVIQNGMFWWIKGNSGNPWDGWWYDNQFFYFAFTEDGDSADQAACQAAGFTSCFVDPNAYKLDVSVKKFAPRYYVPGTPVTILSPPTLTAGNVNPFVRTTNCGADNQPLIYLGNVKTVTSGPFNDINFGGDVGAVPYILIEYFYSGDVNGVYQNRERFYLAQGFGQVRWDVSSWNGTSYNAPSQTSNDVTKVAGAAPTPNFACTVPQPPFTITGNLPAAAAASSRPQNLLLSNSAGTITGTPTTVQTSSFTAQVEDSAGAIAQKALSIAVSNSTQSAADNRYCLASELTSFPGGATTDDIADLPTNCNNTALANTPSPNPPTTIAAGDATGFQAALNTAVCGDVIVLAAGSTYNGSFTMPALNCDIGHWLTIRTSRLDLIPAEGNRALPCDANVQLPNRPSAPWGPGNCGARLRAGMAKIKSAGAFEEAIRIPPHSHMIRFIGIEIEGKTITTASKVSNIINMQATTGSDHIIFDRCWIHGTAGFSYVRAAFVQDGVSHVSLIDSSVTDIHCMTTGGGACTDSQIFQGGNGNSPKVGMKCVNNYLESAGTNSCSLGAASSTTVMPTDFEFRRNYQYKPMIWNPACVAPLPESCKLPDGTAVTYDGLGPYSVKNIFEVKNVIRGLVEGNVMEGNWMHADQNASGILLTPKNQAVLQGSTWVGVCPACVERHVTVRYNVVRTSGGFFQAVNTAGDHSVGDATEGSHYSVHDNIADNLFYSGVINTGFSFASYGTQLWSNINDACTASFVQHDVHFFHNTVLLRAGKNYSAAIQLDGPLGACHAGMVYRDNIISAGTNNGGINQTSNVACAGDSNQSPASKFTNCWTNPFTMTKNAIVGGSKTWPAGNFFPTSGTAVGFVNFANGYGGDYRLCTGAGQPNPSCTGASVFHNAATDGKDVGADVNLVKQYTAGVSPWN